METPSWPFQGKVEYRVRPVTRYHVTRYHSWETEHGESGGSEVKGQFDNPQVAFEVAYALAKEEHQKLGLPSGDERIIYPRPDDPGGPAFGVTEDLPPSALRTR